MTGQCKLVNFSIYGRGPTGIQIEKKKKLDSYQIPRGTTVVHLTPDQKLDSYLILYIKINFRWITTLNVKDKTIKLFKDNIDYLHDLGTRENFLRPKNH